MSFALARSDGSAPGRRARYRYIGAAFQAASVPTLDEPVVSFDLIHRITVRGLWRSNLVLRRPTPRDLGWFALQRGPQEARLLAMTARLCGVPADALQTLGQADRLDLVSICQSLVAEAFLVAPSAERALPLATSF